MKTIIASLLSVVSLAAAHAAVIPIAVGTSSENFNSIANGLPAGWSVYTAGSSSTLGNIATFKTEVTTGWGAKSPEFRNSASPTGLTSGASASTQQNHPDRAPGLSIGGSVGNPGGSFNFNFSTLGVSITSISFDALQLRIGTVASVWSVEYGIGAAPTSWVSLGTYTADVWGVTPLSYDSSKIGTALDDQTEVWFRFIVASGGTGANYDNVGIDNFTITAAAIPEAGTVASVGVGAFFLLGWLFIRKRHETI